MSLHAWYQSSVVAAALLLLLPGSLRSQTTVSFADNLMPRPASLTASEGSLPITSSFAVILTKTDSPRLQAAVLRTMKRLEDKTGVPLPRQIAPTGSAAVLTVSVASDGSAVQSIDEQESYTLTSTNTSVTIEAATTTGALHGLETLVQLVQPSGSGYVVPAVTIRDAPRFRWRGLMIDCGRHFEPMDVLKRNLDAMAAVKLNVFHWHLTEDQGFRIESKVYPKLTQLGSDGLFYTQEDARELVHYARDRGIRVVPEFEMPGHSVAWLVAYPELASGSNPTGIRREFGVSDYAIDPTREETYVFLRRFLTEMVTLFPDQYVHIGGDETPAPDWKKNPRILAFMKAHGLKDNEALQAYFNQRVLTILTALHKRMVGWDEILNPSLPKSIVIQSWRGEASLTKAAQEGFQGVLSAPYYLDGMKPAGVHYLADPVPANTTLTADQQKLILGGEVCMWGEQLDARTIDSRIWPRTAAMAERFWSVQSVTDVDDMYRRLLSTSIELEALGLRHISSEGAGLRELVGTEPIDALREFAQAFEPVSFGERYHQQHTSQLTPLTSFVDAVRPDPPIRHELETATKTFLAEPRSGSKRGIAARDQLASFFRSVANSVPAVRQETAASPRMQPLASRAEQVPGLMQAGQEAIQAIANGTPVPTGWKAKNLQLIEEAKKPGALVRFTCLEALTELVNAVTETK